nr:DUF4158 domain-containing protein [Streptomyces sp. NWU339]
MRPELERFFFLDDDDRDLIALRRTDMHRLGMAVQICTVRYHRPLPWRGPARGAVGGRGVPGRAARHRRRFMREAVPGAPQDAVRAR